MKKLANPMWVASFFGLLGEFADFMLREKETEVKM